jgi:hypothetical protein
MTVKYKQEQATLSSRRGSVLGVVPDAFEALAPGKSISNLLEPGTKVTHIFTPWCGKGDAGRKPCRNGRDDLVIERLGEAGEGTYRVTRTIPGTDSGTLDPHYEFTVANPNGGPYPFRPLALVMQAYFGIRGEDGGYAGSSQIPCKRSSMTGEFVASVCQLTDEQRLILESTGLYVSPEGDDLGDLDRVRAILGKLVG